MRRVGSALLAVLVAGFAPGALAQSGTAEYRIGSEDNLRVTVFGHEDLSGEFLVDGGGRISLPLIGDVQVGGLTVRESARVIVGELKPDYLKNPRVGVEVLNYRPFYILGEVNKPGSYPYVNGMKLINAVALAGGFTHRAQEEQLLIIRSTDPERAEQPATPDTVVLPGDVIKIPERFF